MMIFDVKYFTCFTLRISFYILYFVPKWFNAIRNFIHPSHDMSISCLCWLGMRIKKGGGGAEIIKLYHDR